MTSIFDAGNPRKSLPLPLSPPLLGEIRDHVPSSETRAVPRCDAPSRKGDCATTYLVCSLLAEANVKSSRPTQCGSIRGMLCLSAQATFLMRFLYLLYLSTYCICFLSLFFFTETGGGARPAIVVVVVLSEGRENGSVGHPPLCFSVGGHEHMDLLFPRALIVKPPNDNDKFSEPPATKQELSSTIVAHCSGEGEN
jgi:hypothetical protein